MRRRKCRLYIDADRLPIFVTIFTVLICGCLLFLNFHGKEAAKDIEQLSQEKEMFFDLDELPDLPLLSIETAGGEEPTCVLDEQRPEGCVGVGITENEYVRGQLSLSRSGTTLVNTEMRFRIRGNTPDRLKTPYKIKLDKAADLLQRDEERYKDTDWILLSYGTDLKTCVGMYVSKLCQFEWQPAYEFVNVMINGDWRGCYLLIEAVEKGRGRCDIGDEGFIIENDAYWWNTEDAYFKTMLMQSQMHYEMGYTFKYPTSPKLTAETVERIRQYMDDFEAALYSGDSSYAQYIDVDSFAGWLLFQDIMGSWDGSGTNMFLYKEDFDADNPTSTKIKMGPAWDLESSCTEEQKYRWATVHKSNLMYFKQLLTFDDFKDSYKKQWKKISNTIVSDVENYISKVIEEKGDALSESWKLDAKRWGYEIDDVTVQAEQMRKWFSSRTDWMNRAVTGL